MEEFPAIRRGTQEKFAANAIEKLAEKDLPSLLQRQFLARIASNGSYAVEVIVDVAVKIHRRDVVRVLFQVELSRENESPRSVVG